MEYEYSLSPIEAEEVLCLADKMKTADAMKLSRLVFIASCRDAEKTKYCHLLDDEDVLQFATDYWEFVRYNEHGNECSFAEFSYGEFLDEICGMCPAQVFEYLQECAENGGGVKVYSLIREFESLNKRYHCKDAKYPAINPVFILIN